MGGDRAVDLKRRYNNNDNAEELKKMNFHMFGSERFTGISQYLCDGSVRILRLPTNIAASL